MQETSFNFPTEEVALPSKGLLYSKENPLSKGKVTMKYGTTREEDILTNQNFIKQGIVLDKLLQSMVVDKVDLDTLLAGDKDALLIAARVLLWGSEYKISLNNPNDEANPIPHTVNLAEVKEKFIDEGLIKAGVNEFAYTLPHTNTNVTFKLLTVKDEKNIEAEIKGLKKAGINTSAEMSTRLKFIITSVNGERTQEAVRTFVDRMIARDSRALREYIKKVQPGVDLSFKYDFGNGEVEVPIPLTIEFFWPSAE